MYSRVLLAEARPWGGSKREKQMDIGGASSVSRRSPPGELMENPSWYIGPRKAFHCTVANCPTR